MKEAPPLLIIDDLHIAFESAEVLHGVSLQIAHGEAVALVGESGCGKSVLAQALISLIPRGGSITAGTIAFDGCDITHAPPKEMRKLRGKRIGMIFQDPMTALNPTMTIGRQISESLVLHEGLSHRSAKGRVLDLLHTVGIRDVEERYRSYPFQLSGGMRQRVLIAMAIACRPDLLIADEPTTALDVTIQAQILDLLSDLIQTYRMSMLFITHDLSLVPGLCRRTAVMHQGRIVETADTHQLFASPQDDYTKCLLKEVSYA